MNFLLGTAPSPKPDGPLILPPETSTPMLAAASAAAAPKPKLIFPALIPSTSPPARPPKAPLKMSFLSRKDSAMT